jgi:hypothetical protein
LLAVRLAIVAFEARIVLSTDADDVADLDVLNVLADADSVENRKISTSIPDL